MIPKRVRFAVLLAFLGHGLFVLTASYRLSYDAFTHMFFADHYAKDWFSLWDVRWFGGFEMISYPPLVHQTIGLLGQFIGIEPAYAVIQWLVLTIYPLGIYAFTRTFFGRSASSYASLAGALLSSLYYVTYAFGQLPTLTATLFALFGIASLASFLQAGNKLSGILSIAFMINTMAAHHATLLFLPWAIFSVILHILINKKIKHINFFTSLGVFVLLSALGGYTVIWPFWQWGTKQTIQTPIDHLSRHNFLQDPIAFFAFIIPMYGALILIIPLLLWKGFSRQLIGITSAFLILLLLSLGGTTPLPRLLFGKGWEWLTYDRFAFWSSLILIPFFGIVIIEIRKILPRWFSFKFEFSESQKISPVLSVNRTLNTRRAITILIFIGIGLSSLLMGLIPRIFHIQPKPLDMKPIVEFLNADENSNWRYLTFGFGDQFAHLSYLTNATTIDGSYFTARMIPELRTSGIGLIDTAFWSSKGIQGLEPILKVSADYGVRWGFVYRREYVSMLRENGWVFIKFLSNGVQVWEDPEAVLTPASIPPQTSKATRISWGILPMSSLSITLILLYLKGFSNRKQSRTIPK